MYVDCRLCSRSFPSRRQLSRHFQEVHGDLLECSVCKYTLPATRKYLMEQHITRRHEGKPLTWTVRKRETFRNPGAYQPDFLEYRPRRITSRRSPRKSPRKSPRRPHVQKPTDFNSSPVSKNFGGPSSPITPLRSPSISVSLGSPMEVDLYSINPATPERRVLMKSPVPAISVSSSHPRPLTSPSCGFAAETSPGIVSASGRDHHRPTTETASSVVLPPVSPGPVLSLPETYDPDHLFSMPDFDFLSDLDHQLQASSPSGAQESSLPLKPAVEYSLPVPAHQPKPVSSVPAPSSSSLSTTAKNSSVNVPSYILHKSESSPPSYQSEDLVNDPRFFFAGAPSFEKNDFVACLLQSTNLDARRQGGRKLAWLPLGSFAIERKEELRFPDGRQYCLTSTICRNPHYHIKDTKSTQTDLSTSSSSSSKCDVGTQVSTVQTFTLGD